MGEASGGDRVLAERGAVLVIVGCVFLYLAFLAEARYQGASEPAHLVAGAFILYAAWTLATGFLGLLERRESTRMAGAAYAFGGWVLAAAAARAVAEGLAVGSLTPIVFAGVVAPFVVVSQAYGLALARGVAHPEDEDTVARRTVEALDRVVPGDGRRRTK